MSTSAFALAWNARDPEAVAACYLPGGVRVQIAHPPATIEGRGALAQHVREIMTSWPDCTLETRSESGDNGLITFEWIFRGTQQADYGPIPGRGQRLELAGVSVLTMEGDLIREERVYWDTGTLMASAGMLAA
jgi:ketosteroid isomerase-like protein